MGCYVPFDSMDMEMRFYALRPTVVHVDELVDSLKHFSLRTHTLGCAQSSIFRSIHGSLVVWYGAWMKSENKDQLNATLISMLTNISSMAVLLDQGIFDAYVGEAKDGSPFARFSTGDTISLKYIHHTNDDMNDLSYACLAIFRSRFSKLDGAISGVCLKCQSQTRTMNLIVWKSLQSCYAWVLRADHRNTIMPYLDKFSLDFKYDIFKVVYVSGDYVPNLGGHFPHKMLESGVEGKEGMAK